MSVSYQLIRPDELDEGLLGAWRAIQSSGMEFKSPYFCPEFAQCVGSVRSDARIVVIENDRRPVGFFPYQRGFLGTGRPIGGALSDFHGVVAAQGSEWSLKELMRASKLSVWAFDHLVGNAGTFASVVCERAPSAQIDFSEGYERYVKDRRKKGSDYIPKTEGLARKLERDKGAVEFSLHEGTSPSFDQILKWKSQQYLQSGLTDVLEVPWTAALLRRVAESDGTSFSGVCSTLRVDGRIVAGHVGMRSSQVMHYWLPAYDPEYAKFSTGIILLLRMAQALAQQGLTRIDLGKGASAYKERLMTGSIEVGSGSVELPSALASLRQLRRRAERLSRQGGIGNVFRLPLRIVRRIERSARLQ